jgi:hypothetical protein
MAKKRMVVEAGPRARHNVPMVAPIGRYSKVKLTDEATGRLVPCQVVRGELCWLLDYLPTGGDKAYLIEPGRSAPLKTPGVRATRRGDSIELTIEDRPFTTYNFGKEWARPFFYPVLGPDQVQITRNYPLLQGVPDETTDHFHHKSLWVAHGDVNGSDNWSEERGHGRQVSKRIKEVIEGPVLALLRQDLEWVSDGGKKVCDEEREVRLYATGPGERVLDLSVTFRATAGKLTFGDTKEGGICSVRVATSMDGNKGGRIENSHGALGEAECWGRRAVWCDYSGAVGGKIVGLAIFDTPGNLRYPTYWHVRDYGLMTANPFGISHFRAGSGERGDHVLQARGELRFRYRILMHLGDASIGHVRDKYHDYINPPRVRFER